MIVYNRFISKNILSVGVVFLSIASFVTNANSAPRQAQYANLDYDVVYVRCPRGKPVALTGDTENWNGVNDLWLSASNNIYQQPGCDLMLHRSDLPTGDPNAEVVLVECDEDNPDVNVPVCTIADPNVSFDAATIIYTKFENTREHITSTGMDTDGGWGPTRHYQRAMKIYPNGDGPRGYAEGYGVQLKAFNAPAYIYSYNLKDKKETRISPASGMFAGRAYPQKDPEWTSKIPVIDIGAFFLPDGRIGFTSNRDNGFYKFQLFAMDQDGRNLQLFGHRAMSQQLHPSILMDGRVLYTSHDPMLQKADNNQYSLFTIRPDGKFPFIFAGKHDATALTYHFATQLSDGDVVVAVYYNHNNTGLGTLWRMPVDPQGADFEHQGVTDSWQMGINMLPFARKGQFVLTSQADSGDSPTIPYRDAVNYTLSAADEWIHPDGRKITMLGRFTHPAATTNNDLLVTYAIGGGSQMPGPYGDLTSTMEVIGKDAGIWLIPLAPNSTQQVGHIADDARLVVDDPNYHEIMARPLVAYRDIYGMRIPDPARRNLPPKNNGKQDTRLEAGSPFALSGASSLYDRETRSVNGTPWNAKSGSPSNGRNYMNLASSGADLAIYGNDEVYGIRVVLPIPNLPNGAPGGIESWAKQNHQLRILGEFPIRKSDARLLDAQGNPDTSFMVKLPANTPFLFQSIDKRGMALDIETTSRSAARGEKQLCSGCHVHTREGIDPLTTPAIQDATADYGDFSGDSAPLFDSIDEDGNPVVRTAREIYTPSILPGVDKRRSFGTDWRNGVNNIIQSRCAACHAEGKPAQQSTGLRLDDDDRTYQLLTRNYYTREDATKISASTKPGDGMNDVINETPGTDRITDHDATCCTVSRWLSANSARSSMLVWALYGERMDGRDPDTGMPPIGSGVLVDYADLERPEVWPKVAEHLAYLDGTSQMTGTTTMPESEKRLLARWIDIGAPKLNVHDDLMRPVLTITPVVADWKVSQVLIGIWDDSVLDLTTFVATRNGTSLAPSSISSSGDVLIVNLKGSIDETKPGKTEFVFEIWDSPDRSLSLVDPSYKAANRTRRVVTGKELLRLAGIAPNNTPSQSNAIISTYKDTQSKGIIPSVTDADVDDIHLFAIVTQPSNGKAQVINNRLVYTPDTGFVGSDSFTYWASDIEGALVVGTATVTVLDALNPDLTFTVSSSRVLSGSNVTLTWSTSYASNCTASGGWDGGKDVSGSESVGPIRAATIFTIQCTGPAGTTSKTIAVETTASPADCSGEPKDGCTPSSDGNVSMQTGPVAAGCGCSTNGVSTWAWIVFLAVLPARTRYRRRKTRI